MAGLSEDDWERGDWEFDQRADRRGDAERSRVEEDWKTVADCWRTYERWNVKMGTGTETQVEARYPAQGDPPHVTLVERPEYTKVAMEVGIAAIEAVEAKLEDEKAMREAGDYYTAGLGMELITGKGEE